MKLTHIIIIFLTFISCRSVHKQKNKATIGTNNVNIEVIDIYSPRTKYQVNKLERLLPVSDSCHYTFGLQYELNYEIEYESKLYTEDDSVEVELVNFQIIKNNKSEIWMESSSTTCQDTVFIIPVFKRQENQGKNQSQIITKSGNIKFAHFGSCRKTLTVVLMGTQGFSTLQLWHK